MTLVRLLTTCARLAPALAHCGASSSSPSSSFSSLAADALPASEDEVERKFPLTAEVRARLARLALAPPVHSAFTDRYFDSRAFALTRRDLWLRRRDAVWELKSPQPPAGGGGGDGDGVAGLAGVDFYRESRDWPSIASVAARLAGVHLAPPFPIAPAASADMSAMAAEAWLAARGIEVFADVTTSRERRSLVLACGHHVRLDLDSVAFFAVSGPRHELSRYEIGEVELVAAGGGAAPATALADVFEQLGIGAEAVRGKLLELLARHRPEHYDALRESGLLASKLGSHAAQR